jgi:S1-C subfamily serine protease
LAIQEPPWALLGSGVTVGPGIVATAAHVLRVGTPLLAIRVVRDVEWGSNKDYAALISGGEGASDIALLTVAEMTAPSANLASKDDIVMGSEVFFVGHPGIIRAPTLGTGVVSTVELPWIVDGQSRLVYGLAASVNKGNSGGGVFLRSSGKLVGLVNAKAGSLGDSLTALRDARFTGGIAIKGVNPIAALQQTLREMDANLQLGIGAFTGVQHLTPLLGAAKKP